MFKQIVVLSLMSLMGLSSCTSRKQTSVLNTFSVRESSNETELVWVGKGSTTIYQNGTWVATPSEDYTFMVYQKRFNTQWKSHKIMNRLNEDYSGIAGNVDQQHLFVVSYELQTDGSRKFDILSTMGNGEGVVDNKYENATMFIDAGISAFAPYSHIRLTQKYDYVAGTLNEIIDLVKVEDDESETPYIRITESASLFRK